MIHFLDISGSNGVRDFGALRKAGIAGLYHRSDDGSILDAGMNAEFVKGCRESGIACGGYIFLEPRPGGTGAEEIDSYMIPVISHADWGKPGDLKMVIDCERSSFFGAGMSVAAAEHATLKYVESAVSRATAHQHGHHPLVYCGAFLRELVGRTSNAWMRIHCSRLLQCDLWVPGGPEYETGGKWPDSMVDVVRDGLLPRHWRDVVAWQWTSDMKMDELTGEADASVLREGLEIKHICLP